MAADHAVAHLAGSLVWNVHQIGSAHRFEQLGRHVVGRAGAGGGVVELSGLGLGISDEFLEVLRRHRRMDHHHQVGIVDPRHRHEVAHQLKRLVGNERFVGRMGVRHCQQRVAVGRRLGDRIGADDRAGAGPVLHHEGLLERVREMLGENAGVNVGGPAGAERHDDPDRTRWVILGLQGCGPRQYRRKRESERNQRNAARQYDHAISSDRFDGNWRDDRHPFRPVQ